MTGFIPFLRKELFEIRRTWRVWMLPGMLVFLGITSPIIAAVTPALLRSISGSRPGVTIKIPTPTSLDAFAQFLKNLDQFVLIAVIIAGAGAISGERASGTAILMLTKPLSRGAFVVAKIVSQFLLLLASTVLGTVACVMVTAAIFGGGNNARLLTAVTLWLLYASLLIVAMTLFSAAFLSRGAAAGAGLGFFFLTLLFSNWAPTAHYTFLGLLPAMGQALTGQQQPWSLGWPLTTAVIAIIGGAWAAVRTFERQEL